ncbi:MAG TPA: bacteriohopanetetrol glucosamine biosynthesis glycosyltransferase HpnI [Terriglobia bacterium]|nr:bacteriohopanetetrol glucosamine biosynthesis glycosyltransferase HpnI [Terriglobia bacterium]
MHSELLLKESRDLILILPCAAFLYYVVAAVCARRFFRHAPNQTSGFTPPVSVLKPVRGVDREAYENFASFCSLDYPEYEILFGVSDPRDPVVPIIQRLIQDFPRRRIRLYTGMAKLGPNDKASVLAHLAREASYEILVVSDSDTRATSDCLRAIAAPFHTSEVGAVTCLYRGVSAKTFGDTMEALGISSDFFGGVFVAQQFAGARFALGATMAITRKRLEEIGNFEALAEFLLDDFELGRRIAALGYRVELIAYSAAMVLPSQTWRAFWQRQLRWAVGVRHANPWAHLGLLLTQGLPFTVLAVAACRSAGEAATYISAYFVSRYAMAFSVGLWGLQDSVLRKRWWLVPVRDALSFGTWLASIPNSRVSWRGKAFYVREGRLIPDEVADSR